MTHTPESADTLELIEHVRDALQQLYNLAGLSVHPLADILALPASADRGHVLQGYLLAAIATTRPRTAVPTHTSDWRNHQILQLRYVEAQRAADVAETLGLSERQLRRDQPRVIAMLIAPLRNLAAQPATPMVPPTTTNFDAEIARIGAVPAADGTALAPLLGRIAPLVATLAATAQTTLRIGDVPALPTLPVNSTALRQMLIALLSCAIEYCRTVDLTVVHSGDHVELLVRGQQGHAPPSDDERLDVCQRLALLQGVQCAISAADDGLHARLALPTARMLTILVIDDNPDAILLFRRHLAAMHGRVIGCVNGEEARDLVRQHQPDLVVLDVMMPIIDGWEVLQRLKHDQETRTTPVVVSSVLKDRALALSLGADDFLAKPVDHTQLRAIVARWGGPS